MKKIILSVFFSTILLYSAVVIKNSTVLPVSSSDLHCAEKVCIIDAGHGGFDAGASADDGTKEKDLNLQMAKKLNEILIFNGYDTVMIREDDVSVEEKTDTHKKKGDIRKRYKVASQNPDALFISIHQNSFKQRSSRGLQVFYGVKNAKSRILAECIQDTIREKFQKDNRRTIKKAGNNLYLLSNIENVCVMIECGFISNKNELFNLKDEEYQQKLMLYVFEGIEKYFEGEGKSSGKDKETFCML